MEYGVWNISYSITYSIRIWIESLRDAQLPTFAVRDICRWKAYVEFVLLTLILLSLQLCTGWNELGRLS